ncbi:hypothetical protein ATZ36_05660 [Candidatus Endomicrobiellum trichonymphae]|uniref:Uncharacterized protein n=1 Tax=Endomicrobium trichonymphae TaxID=1408204 RepID=A0A1E5II76_ENDTX|nr:hypothetical protein ATZ36_05660 [Candidatus Endomicrobium trichonymphae]
MTFCCRDNIRRPYSAGRKICPDAYEKFLNVTNNPINFTYITKSLETANNVVAYYSLKTAVFFNFSLYRI